MTPHFFIGHNFVYQPPTNWDHDGQGECVPLPVKREEMGGLTSVWKPTKEQLAILNAEGGISVWLGVNQQPIMALGVVSADQIMVSV